MTLKILGNELTKVSNMGRDYEVAVEHYSFTVQDRGRGWIDQNERFKAIVLGKDGYGMYWGLGPGAQEALDALHLNMKNRYDELAHILSLGTKETV